MARGVNKCILIGNLGADPETRFMPSGGAVTKVRPATSKSWKDRQTGQMQERTEWHQVIFFNKLGEIAGDYLKKGSKVYIEGSLRTRKWQGQDGQDRYTTEIVASEMQMLDGRGDGQPSKNGGHGQNSIGAGSILHRKMQAALSANGGPVVGIAAEMKQTPEVTGAVFHAHEVPAGTKLYTHPAPPSVAVPEGWKLVPIEPTEEMRKRAGLSRGADFYTISKVWDAMLTAAPSPDHSGGTVTDYGTKSDHIADAGKVEPIGYLTNQAVARLQSDKRMNGEHLYAFKPDDMSKFQAVYLGPAVKDSLTVDAPSVPENEKLHKAIADDLELWLSQVRYMEGLSAHDIIESAEDYISMLRTAGDEGEGA